MLNTRIQLHQSLRLLENKPGIAPTPKVSSLCSQALQDGESQAPHSQSTRTDREDTQCSKDCKAETAQWSDLNSVISY